MAWKVSDISSHISWMAQHQHNWANKLLGYTEGLLKEQWNNENNRRWTDPGHSWDRVSSKNICNIKYMMRDSFSRLLFMLLPLYFISGRYSRRQFKKKQKKNFWPSKQRLIAEWIILFWVRVGVWNDTCKKSMPKNIKYNYWYNYTLWLWFSKTKLMWGTKRD